MNFIPEQDDLKPKSELSRRCRNNRGVNDFLSGNVFGPHRRLEEIQICKRTRKVIVTWAWETERVKR